MIDQLRKIMAHVRTKVQRGIISGSKNPKGGEQLLQIRLLNGEVRNDVELMQQYGFSSRPLDGAEHVTAKLASMEHVVVVATEDRRYRFKDLGKGEVAISTDEGDFIHFKRGNQIEIGTSSLTINAGGSSLTLSAAGATLKSAGVLTLEGSTINMVTG